MWSIMSSSVERQTVPSIHNWLQYVSVCFIVPFQMFVQYILLHYIVFVLLTQCTSNCLGKVPKTFVRNPPTGGMLILVLILWYCDIVILWHCDIVTLWHCGIVTSWHCCVSHTGADIVPTGGIRDPRKPHSLQQLSYLLIQWWRWCFTSEATQHPLNSWSMTL